ncbi:MAG: hypothetical protein KBC32_10960 [Candidatus Didemnitutus sp.]|nr:hypothetical protein [Candidatus Didemnitutus sp.]
MNLSSIRTSLLFLVAFLGLSAISTAEDSATPLEYTRLDLTDGRKLKNVVIRSYDASRDRFLVIADRKAMTLAATLIPAPIAEQLKAAAPQTGTSVSTTTKSPDQPPRQTVPPRQSEPQTAPARPPRAQASAPDQAPAHRKVAVDHAENFYRYEFKVGSDAIRVQSIRIEASAATPVTGWAGRYRTQGTAHLEIFDTKGWSATRAKSTFEIITEEKPGEPILIIDFSRKT